MFLTNLGGPNSSKITPSLRNQSSSLGPTFEFESKVHEGVFWTPSFLDLYLNVHPPLDIVTHQCFKSKGALDHLRDLEGNCGSK